jgi:DNA polymerase-3 subunit beta
MKLIVIRSNLKDALSSLERSSGENQQLPALRNVLLEADHGTLQLTATNLEVAATTKTTAKVIEKGKTTVPLALFISIVSHLQTERVNLELRGASFHIQTDNYEASLQTISAEEFPIIPKIKSKNEYLACPLELLKSSISQITPCAATTDARPELGAVLFAFTLDNLKLIATDSYRLGEKTIPKTQLAHAPKSPLRALVPARAAQELLRALRGEGEVKIYFDENQALFESEETSLITRLIDGTFPDYESLIPKTTTTTAAVDREEFLGAIKLTGSFSSRTSEVRVRIPNNKNHIELLASDQALGENTYILSAKTSGPEKEIGFNTRYLGDGLRTTTGESISLGLTEDTKPALIRSTTDNTFVYLVMPILKF